nr:hypothetical protein [Bacilli bacterium]
MAFTMNDELYAEVAPKQKYDELPVGTYLCQVTETKVEKSHNDNPTWYNTLRVISGEHKNRVIFSHLTLLENALSYSYLKNALEEGFNYKGSPNILLTKAISMFSDRFVNLKISYYMSKKAANMGEKVCNMLYAPLTTADLAVLADIATAEAAEAADGTAAVATVATVANETTTTTTVNVPEVASSMVLENLPNPITADFLAGLKPAEVAVSAEVLPW